MKTATHLIKLWIFDSFPENYTNEMVAVAMRERYSSLGDKLENVQVESLKEKKK